MSRKPRYVKTKYVFFCDQCECWYDSDDWLDECECGTKLRKLEGEELNEFYYKIAHPGYRLIEKP